MSCWSAGLGHSCNILASVSFIFRGWVCSSQGHWEDQRLDKTSP